MVTTIERRVAALEKSAGGGGDGCGYCGDDGGDGDESYEIIFADDLPDDLEENCPECGRGLMTTIYFDDDPRAPWNATVDTVDT
jgi:hypothetical protein